MLTGTWNLTLVSPMGLVEATLELVEEGGVLTGQLTNEQGSAPIENGTAGDSGFEFKVKIGTPIGMINFRLNGSQNGDSLVGKAKMPMGSFDFTGKKA